MTMTASTNGKGATHPPRSNVSANRTPMVRVVRAVIRKELQQNWINLALVICLEFIIVFTAEWFRSGWLFESSHEFGNLLLYPAVRGAITLGCAAAGLLLGVLQPLADRNFDLWAFLTHRPVPRWWLYLGRTLAGVTLYLIAAGLPVAFALIIAPTPWGGHFFLSDYLLPPVADWFAGLVYYFAGLLIMERQARWYGSRAVPLLTAIAGSLLVAFANSFSLAVVTSLVLIAVYVGAALGSAVSHGYTLRAPRWTRLLAALVMLAAFTSLLSVSAVGGLSRVVNYRNNIQGHNYEGENGNPFWTHKTNYTVRSYHLLRDTTLGILTVHYKQAIVNNRETFVPVQEEWTDVDGHTIPESRTNREDELGVQGATFNTVGPAYSPGYRELDERVTKISHAIPNTDYQNTWYWVPERGLYYLYQMPVYSDNPKKRPTEYLGTVGANGFAPSGKDAEPFERPVYSDGFNSDRFLLVTPHAVYLVDTLNRTVTRLLSVPSDETITGINVEEDRIAKEGDQWRIKPVEQSNIWIATSQRLLRVSPSGDILLTLQLPSVKGRLKIQPFLDIHRWVVEVDNWYGDWGSMGADSKSYWFYDDRGTLVDVKNIPNAYEYTEEPVETLLPTGVHELHQTEFQAGALVGAANPLTFTIGALSPWLFPSNNYTLHEILASVSLPPGMGWRFFLALAAVMAACGVAGWLLTRAYALPRRGQWLWTVVSFLCGPAALLTFVATHRLPRRTKCPACGRLRLRRDERCGKCNAPWPAPAATGTEIFTSPTPSPV